MCKIGASHLFLGSRLGNSLLLRISEANSEIGAGETPAKRPRVQGDEQLHRGEEATDLEDLSIYGIAPTETSHDARLKLAVCDST